MCLCVRVVMTDRMDDSASLRLGHNVKHNKRDASRRIRTSSHRQTQIHTHTQTRAQAAPKCSRHAPTSLAPIYSPPHPSGSALFLVPQATNPFRLLFLTCATTTATKTTAANQKLNTHTQSNKHAHTDTHTQAE